jgi:nucleotide-binding universal stress UspA family protein
MRVVVATDGSKESLAAAQQLKAFADPTKITEVIVVAVVSPLAAVPFENDLTDQLPTSGDPGAINFVEEAEGAADAIMAEFSGWGPAVSRRLRSGSPAPEIVKVAADEHADLVVVASGARGLTNTILLGSTAQRVQHSAPCPVLVARSAPHHKGGRMS